MAEEWGFEPQRPVTSLRAFQARPFNHLGIPPVALVIIHEYLLVVINFLKEMFR